MFYLLKFLSWGLGSLLVILLSPVAAFIEDFLYVRFYSNAVHVSFLKILTLLEGKKIKLLTANREQVLMVSLLYKGNNQAWRDGVVITSGHGARHRWICTSDLWGLDTEYTSWLIVPPRRYTASLFLPKVFKSSTAMVKTTGGSSKSRWSACLSLCVRANHKCSGQSAEYEGTFGFRIWLHHFLFMKHWISH